VSDLI